MKKITIKIPTSLSEVNRFLRKRFKLTNLRQQKLKILDTDNFQTYCNIKPDTWDEQVIAAVYQISEERRIKYFHPKQDIKVIPNAIIENGSDIVIVDEGVIWDKYSMCTFSKQRLGDYNLIERPSNGFVKINRYPTQEYIKGICISLLGTSAYAWAHFIEQYLPKVLYALEMNLLKTDVTLIIPDTQDKNVLELIELVVKGTNCKIISAQYNVEYLCELLYYMPTGAQCGSGAYYHSTFDTIIPDRVKKHFESILLIIYVQTYQNKRIVNYICLEQV